MKLWKLWKTEYNASNKYTWAPFLTFMFRTDKITDVILTCFWHPLSVHGRVEGDGEDGGGEGALGQPGLFGVGEGLDQLVDGRLGHAVANHA